MISPVTLKALNKQLNEEHYNAMFYLAVSTFAKFAGYLGAEKWLKKQYDEEVEHMEKICDYINEQNRVFTISTMPGVTGNFDELLDIFEAALKREKETTSSVNEVRNVAIAEKDQATEVFMQWYVKEQVQEEDMVQDIVSRLKIAGSNPAALLYLDQELGQR